MRTELTDACEMIYELYPRHIAKRAAEKAIMNAIIRLHDGEAGTKLEWSQAYEFLKERTRLYGSSPMGNRGTFTPHATTWFNQARYLDDPKEWERGSEAQQQNGVPEGWLQ